MQLKVNTGRILVKRLAPKEEEGGILLVEEANKWGEVIAVGPPATELEIQSIVFEEGDIVLLPGGGIRFDDKLIYWQHEIPYRR